VQDTLSRRSVLGNKAVGNARIEDLLEVFSRDREGRTQSIVEVKL